MSTPSFFCASTQGFIIGMASSFVLGMAVASSPYLVKAFITYGAEVTVRLVGRLLYSSVSVLRNLVASEEEENDEEEENPTTDGDECVIWDTRWHNQWQTHWNTQLQYHEPRLFAEVRNERMGGESEYLLPSPGDDTCLFSYTPFGLFSNNNVIPVFLPTTTSFEPPFEPPQLQFDNTRVPVFPATSSTIPCLHSYHHNEENERIEIVIDSDTDSTGSDEISRRIMDEAGYLSRSLTLDDRVDTPVPELSGDEELEEEEVENDDIASVWSVVSESDAAVQGSSPESEKGPLPTDIV